MSEFSEWLLSLPELSLPASGLEAQAQGETSKETVAEAGPGAVEEGGTSAFTVVGIALLVVVLLAVVWKAMSGSGGSAGGDAAPTKGQSDRPTKSVLDDRREVEKPSDINEEDSLATIKDKKREKVKVSSYEEAKEHLQKRKAQQVKKDQQERLAKVDEEEGGQDSTSDQDEAASDEAQVTLPELEAKGLVEEEVDSGWGEINFDVFDISSSQDVDIALSADASGLKGDNQDEPVRGDADGASDEEAAEPEAAPSDEGEAVEPDAVPEEVSETQQEDEEPENSEKEAAAAPKAVSRGPERKSLQEGLEKTRGGFITKLNNLFKRQAEVDDQLIDELEEVLYTADIGTKSVKVLLEKMRTELEDKDAGDPSRVWAFMRQWTLELLTENESPLVIGRREEGPFVMLVVGANGVGKTTTIGKLAMNYTEAGHKVLMVAGDTFRAAATEQLEEWGQRTGLAVHSSGEGVDPASVVFDGIKRAREEGFDVVICDTAGRLTNKKNLMKELEKIGRVAGKALDGAPHETLLALDANTGQMAAQQARLFQEVVNISGIVLTKLDGTAKGGMLIAICQELGVPVRYIGIGEGVYDLRTFDAQEFVDALFL